MFTDGETYTVIVSSSWCFGDSQSYYPPDTLSKLDFNKLLAKHKEPGISWKTFKIRHRNLTNSNTELVCNLFFELTLCLT